MNNLSLMLNKAAKEGKFGYHHHCDIAKLTHLCFADDLLIFVDGSVVSVQNVLEVLKEFEEKSGLAISLQKSSLYSGGLIEEEITSITSATGLPHGTLPVRYLGVPLCTKKLTLQNCRLVLINTVIAGISNFWCSTFMLPKACIRKINSMCSAFLWKGHLEGHHNARVSWDTLTKTKEQGGLGIRDLATWNMACVLKLIWLLFFRLGSVWVAWFWSDNWSPFGNLSNFLSPARLGIHAQATLDQVYNHGNWSLPNPRSENQVSLQAYLTTLHLSEEEDHYEWQMEGKIYQKYSTRGIYNCIYTQHALFLGGEQSGAKEGFLDTAS
ncbi:PREDICTED: uncharacterized protein LOC104753325 [Camelina sativa]|uniref:Uncharacterized protein LOC104753325 n=1 Tax=Camelina sativa TaxID=90675 RepID=A0ABM0WNZ4_CAMSA|nr:PREDICTED: uncharacterized protein LOC104753325 [Camelina sativa]